MRNHQSAEPECLTGNRETEGEAGTIGRLKPQLTAVASMIEREMASPIPRPFSLVVRNVSNRCVRVLHPYAMVSNAQQDAFGTIPVREDANGLLPVRRGINDMPSFVHDVVTIEFDGDALQLAPGQTAIPHGPDNDLNLP